MTAADRLTAVAERLADVGRTALLGAADQLVDVANREARRYGGPDLYGKRDRPIPLTARVDVDQIGDRDHARLQGVSPGAWVWFTDGVRPHQIPRRRAGPLSVLTVDHPGIVGRGAWRNVRDDAHRVVVDTARDAVREAIHG